MHRVGSFWDALLFDDTIYDVYDYPHGVLWDILPAGILGAIKLLFY